eukprot:3443013-Prymnesium_polylepis.1
MFSAAAVCASRGGRVRSAARRPCVLHAAAVCAQPRGGRGRAAQVPRPRDGGAARGELRGRDDAQGA